MTTSTCIHENGSTTIDRVSDGHVVATIISQELEGIMRNSNSQWQKAESIDSAVFDED